MCPWLRGAQKMEVLMRIGKPRRERPRRAVFMVILTQSSRLIPLWGRWSIVSYLLSIYINKKVKSYVMYMFILIMHFLQVCMLNRAHRRTVFLLELPSRLTQQILSRHPCWLFVSPRFQSLTTNVVM